MNSRSWDYKTSFYIYNTNNRLILACQVGRDMHSSCFWQVIIETMTGDQWNNDQSDRPEGPDRADDWSKGLIDPYH